MIDWNNPDDKISDYFTVREALWLPTWKRLANESDGLTDDVKTNLVDLFDRMDHVRDVVGPIIVHVAFRPETYNKLIGGAPNSAHKYGKAVDFHCVQHGVLEMKEEIIKANLLDTLQMRMESITATPTWCHLDTNELLPGHSRIFVP